MRETSTPAGRRWVLRLLVVPLLALAGLGLTGGPASADSGNCDPGGVPDHAGSGMPGRIDDRPAVTKGQDPADASLYEQYGWSGLNWHTCDLGDGSFINSRLPEAGKDTAAWLDTNAGNIEMGMASSLAALMTQLDQWVSDPGSLLAPIDNIIDDVSSTIRDSVWGPWAFVVVVGAACCMMAWARRGEVRRIWSSVVAIFLAAMAVAALGAPVAVPGCSDPDLQWCQQSGAVALGKQFDSVATEVVGSVNSTAAGLTGNESSNVAYGASLYDKILVPLWVEGAVGPGAGDVKDEGSLAHAIFTTNTAAYDESPDGKLDAYKDVAQILDGKKVDSSVSWGQDKNAYNQLRGTSGSRTGLGFEALVTMICIAVIRIPCSGLLLLGLVVIRLVVMFIPIWGLFAIIEVTRPTTIAAFKMVVASVYNAAVFGVFGAVHVMVVTAIIMSGPFNFVKLLLIVVLTIVFWVVSKPFRSVTKPATGDLISDSGRGLSDSMKRGGQFLSTYAANRLANRGRRPAPAPAPAEEPVPSYEVETDDYRVRVYQGETFTPPVRRRPEHEDDGGRRRRGRGERDPNEVTERTPVPIELSIRPVLDVDDPVHPDTGEDELTTSTPRAGRYVPPAMRPAPADEGVEINGHRVTLRPVVEIPQADGDAGPWRPPEERNERWWRDPGMWKEPTRTRYGYDTWDPWTPDELDGKRPSRAR